MVNRIHLGRKTPASKLDILQKDVGVWNAAQAIGGYLDGKHLDLLTHQDFADFLTTQFNEVVITPEPVWYEWVWNPVLDKWQRVCHAGAAIAVRNVAGEDPIVLSLDDSATYT